PRAHLGALRADERLRPRLHAQRDLRRGRRDRKRGVDPAQAPAAAGSRRGATQTCPVRIGGLAGFTPRLSVLDQSPIPEGSTGSDALHNTLDLAKLADSLGYERYWVAEHHGTPGLASAAPEVLIGPIAAATARIRVGSGGIMLPHYSPF